MTEGGAKQTTKNTKNYSSNASVPGESGVMKIILEREVGAGDGGEGIAMAP